ncbi:hypothetical protein TARUN_2153 [Trichoderma arundinaceum]|uniref:Uncharacterized protein n=1 Tax=Trichoderma arundinaceum TaxID=490622 RepID=A0A395NVF6_TRIAR|nr:hypothetical protein TARUN_2153 [Trichoderma arundinaceum]
MSNDPASNEMPGNLDKDPRLSSGQEPSLEQVSIVGGGDEESGSQPFIDIYDGVHKIRGVDCIWHNMYAESTFTTFRWIPAHEDVDSMLIKVARNVEQGLYSIISLSASKHSLTVVCACEKNWEDLPQGWYCN